MHKKDIEDYKKRLKLTKEQREIVIGLLLGDAHFETQNRGKTYRMKIEQSAIHRDYVDHLYQVFRKWVLTPPKTKSVVTRNKLTQNYRFQTVNHGAFRYYAHQFYCAHKKCVPKLINRMLTQRAIAYWFMDDGSIKSKESKGIIFNTQGYIKKDVERLVSVLKEKFSLKAKPRKQKEGYQIYISGDSYERFCNIVKPYLIKEMSYKLPPARLTSLPKM